MVPPVTASQVRDLLAAHASVQLPSGEEIQKNPDGQRFLESLAEASFLVSHGDHRLATTEMNCLVGTLSELSSGSLDRSALAGMIYEYSSALVRDGLDQRLAELAGRFGEREMRLRLLAFASLVAMCDRSLQEGERDVLQKMASRMNIPENELLNLVSAMQKSLHDAAPR